VTKVEKSLEKKKRVPILNRKRFTHYPLPEGNCHIPQVYPLAKFKVEAECTEII